MIMLSLIIPCYNSSETVLPVIREVEKTIQERADVAFEIIAVVDGSPDTVCAVLLERAHVDEHLRVIELSKNFGQANALMAGYNHANGDIIITLDDDGQCPTDKLWDLIAPIELGADMAIAQYPKKKQSFFKNFGSKVNSIMAHIVMKFPKELELSNFYAFNKLVRNQIVQYKNPFPYLFGLVFSATHKIVNVPMDERERLAGTTNYTFSKLLSLWLNGFTSFSIAPLRVADILGVACACVGFIFGVYIIIRKLLFDNILVGYSSLLAIILFVGGIIMILLGLIGEYIGRIFICINQNPQYVIRAMYGFERTNQDD